MRRTFGAFAAAILLLTSASFAKDKDKDTADNPPKANNSAQIFCSNCAGMMTDCAVIPSTESIGLEELLLRHSADLPGKDALRESWASAVMMIPVPRSGVLEIPSISQSCRSGTRAPSGMLPSTT